MINLKEYVIPEQIHDLSIPSQKKLLEAIENKSFEEYTKRKEFNWPEEQELVLLRNWGYASNKVSVGSLLRVLGNKVDGMMPIKENGEIIKWSVKVDSVEYVYNGLIDALFKATVDILGEK